MLQRLKSFVVIASGIMGLLVVGYGCQVGVEQIKNAEEDAATIAAFIQIVPDGVLYPSDNLQPTPYKIASNLLSARPDAVNLAEGEKEPQLVAANPNSLFGALLVPFVNEARKRRAELARSDPEYFNRVNRHLNTGRINFLLFGYGETHEPPITEKALIGSQTIISYDLRTYRADIVSFTHDIRAPEIERELVKRGHKSGPVRIDQAYNVGGFPLMRRMIENATGLSIDFQITFRDSVMQGLVDNVFQGINVNVPITFDVHPFYLDGKKYDQGRFAAGPQKLSGRQTIQFIKTVPVAEGMYDKVLEHNARKSLVFDAILESLTQNYKDRGFWLRASTFIAGEMVSGSIVYDFDPFALIVNNIGATTTGLQRLSDANSGEMVLPKIRRSKYIVDAAHGDGGVQWVTANAAHNPITQKDIEKGIYNSLDMEVPITANPYGDLASEYWTSVRNLVNHALTAPTVMYNFPTP